MVAHEVGFQSLTESPVNERLSVDGALPSWLEGVLIRNGPGQFETDRASVDHWFDGLALLRGFRFQDGEVRFRARYLESEAYRTAQTTGRLPTGGFASKGSWLQQLKALFRPEPTDNTNVNVARYGDRFVALTEAPKLVEFDPESLETRGSFDFDDNRSPHLVSAHPVRDPYREETVNIGVQFGRQHRYLVHRIPNGSTERLPIATLPVDRPAYVHSFGLTANYVVLVEFPLVINLRKLLSPFSGAFVDSFQWVPERGTRFRLIDRDDGAVAADRSAPACFGFHHVNAFERDGHALIDLVAFDGPEVFEQLYLDRLRSTVPDLGGELRRYELPLDGGAADQLSAETLTRGLTLPNFDRSRTTRPYRFVFGQGRATAFDHRIVGVHVESGETSEYVERHAYFSEPVAVRPPAGDPEDLIVITVGLDTRSGQSFLLVLEGTTLDERARAPLPVGLPFDFHGQFFRR